MKHSTTGSMNSKVTTSGKNDSGTIVTEETQKTSSNGSDGPSTWATKPDDAVIHDDAFWVKKNPWGTFVSVGTDDREIITSLTEGVCIEATRGYLKQRQEGFTENAPTYDSFVGGKL